MKFSLVADVLRNAKVVATDKESLSYGRLVTSVDKLIDDETAKRGEDDYGVRQLQHAWRYGKLLPDEPAKPVMVGYAQNDTERLAPKSVNYESVENCINAPICDGACPTCGMCIDRAYYGDSAGCGESGAFTDAYEIDCNYCPNCGQALDWKKRR